jgi:hypothetical protein
MFVQRYHAFAVLVAVTFVSTPFTHLTAAPLTSAEVTKIINQVSVVDPAKGGHPALLREIIKNDLALQTGIKSRSELLFQDNTLTRIGAETFFSFKTGTRDLTLEKGSMLLQVPKGLGGAKIRTAAVTAAITGTTIMMEYIPNQYIKVLVLEGSLRLSRNGTFGDSLLLHPGKMVIMRPDAKRIPDPIDVDLEHIVKTSTLVNFPNSPALPSMPLIQASIDDQHKQVAKNDLVPTNLVIGRGTKMVVASNSPLAPTAGASGATGAPLYGAVNVNSKNGVSLPLVGNVLSASTSTVGSVANLLGTAITLTSPTTVNNLLSSSTSSVGTVANNLLGTTSTVTTLPISSSNQVLSLLSNTVPSAGGTIAVIPTAANVAAAVPAVATAVAQPIAGGRTAPAGGGGLLGGLLSTVLGPVNALTTIVSAPVAPPTGAPPARATIPGLLSLGPPGH